MNTITDELTQLISLLSPEKLHRIETVLDNRTRHATVVLEDIYQPHNASAALRSCEIFGVQDVHIVEQRNTFSPVRDIALGSSSWLTLSKYKGIQPCYNALKDAGYTIAVTAFTPNACSLYDLPLNKPLALVFGSEREGISQQARQNADIFFTIPMYGFTQSFNVSVSVALSLQHVIHTLRASTLDWKLSQAERDILLACWIKQIKGMAPCTVDF